MSCRNLLINMASILTKSTVQSIAFFIILLLSDVSFGQIRDNIGISDGTISWRDDDEFDMITDDYRDAAKYYRFGIEWEKIEITNGVLNSDSLTRIDNLIDTIVASGMEPVAMIGYAPRWTVPPTIAGDHLYCGSSFAPGTSYANDWEDFCSVIASMYGDRIRYYEIGNEVNSSQYYQQWTTPTETSISYAEFLKIASVAIRNSDSNDDVFIITAGLQPNAVTILPTPPNPDCDNFEFHKISTEEWMMDFYATPISGDDSIHTYYDGFGYHPYASWELNGPLNELGFISSGNDWRPPANSNDTNYEARFIHHPNSAFLFTEDVRRIMTYYGDHAEIWGTECGLGTAIPCCRCNPIAPQCNDNCGSLYPRFCGINTHDGCMASGLYQEELQADYLTDYIERWTTWTNLNLGPLLFYSPKDVYVRTADPDIFYCDAMYGMIRNDGFKKQAYYELRRLNGDEISGSIDVYSEEFLVKYSRYMNNASITLMNDITLSEPIRFGSGHRVVIKSATSSSPKTITGCLALNDCSLTLENVNIEQPANYASRDSSFVGLSNISLGEQAKLYIKGLNSRVHMDGQIAGTPDSLLIENADLSNSHDVAFMRMGGGEIVLTNCDMNDAENFGDLSTFRFADSNVHFTDFTCVGGFSDSSTVELLNSNAVFEDCRIQLNSSLYGVGGVYFRSTDDHILVLRGLELRDNETVDQTRPGNVYMRGGDIDLSDSRGASFICESLGCTSNAPQVVIDVASRSDRTVYSIQNCLFRGGSVYINSIDNGLLPEVCAIRNVIIDNCHVTANRAGGTLEHVTITSTGQVSSDTAVPFTARRSIFSGNTTGIVFPANGHNWTPSMGDPMLSASGEPKWNSPCLDQLDDELGEFDLTPGDLGAKVNRVIRNLPMSVLDSLPVGNYTISHGTMIRGFITPGSVIKINSGGTLLIWPNTDNNHTRKIGDINGPRITIVGRPDRNALPASKISIKNQDGGDLAQLILEGVLFNYAPRYVNPEGLESALLSLENWNPSYCDGPQIDGTNVKFLNYVDASLPNGTYDGGLLLDNCSGAIRSLDFGQANGPAWLQLSKCRIDVDSNTFEPQGDVPCLKVDGVLTGETPNLIDNLFRVVANGNTQTAPMLDASGGLLNLRRNQFLNCQTTPISLLSSSLHADQEARNNIRAANNFTDSQPLIGMLGGYLNLFCGRNNFVVRQYNMDWPIVSWMPDTSNAQALMTWRENFWGTTCQSGISETELNNRSLAIIPPWATVVDNLSECVEASTPANPVCPFETNTPKELLQNGKTAEILGNFSLAQDNYRALLWLWADMKESNEGTLRLKALGLHKEYGPEAYELVRDDLFTAADSSHVVKLAYQEVLQRCSAWCTEARWGDRTHAVQVLNSMLSLAIDQGIRDIIKRALLEIATYPPLGGLQALDGDALFTQALVQQSATASLMNYQSGQDLPVAGVVEQPKTFEIAHLYPNPFNATVTLELAFPSDGEARVRVYNLLGQVVQTMLDQRVDAGVRKSTLDASGWSSGLYFVVAEHKGTVQVRKLTLLK